MACRLFGTKPLSEPILAYWLLDPPEHTPFETKKTTNFIQESAFENVVDKNDGHFVFPLNVLTHSGQHLTNEKHVIKA